MMTDSQVQALIASGGGDGQRPSSLYSNEWWKVVEGKNLTFFMYRKEEKV